MKHVNTGPSPMDADMFTKALAQRTESNGDNEDQGHECAGGVECPGKGNEEQTEQQEESPLNTLMSFIKGMWGKG